MILSFIFAHPVEQMRFSWLQAKYTVFLRQIISRRWFLCQISDRFLRNGIDSASGCVLLF